MARTSTRITAITFDADETLWAFAAAQRRAFESVLVEMQAMAPAARGLTLDALMRVQGEMVAAGDATQSWEHRRLDAFRETLARLGSPDEELARHFTATYLRVRYDSIELFADVVPVLEQLGRTYTLGLISNGNTRASRCGLPGVFDVELYAEDHGGACKPDRRMFDAAAQAADCSFDELLHIGDSLASDVQGALAVGAVAVWLNRDGLANETGIVPTREIRSLVDLPGVLRGLALATDRSGP